MLMDRVVEIAALERVLAAVRDGLSGVLVLRGEAGIGKTALVDNAVARAGDMQVARVVGVESEIELGFAALHQLLVPFLGGLERLPVPQREALQLAFGLIAGLPPNRFLVGLATLTLITDAAVERPVLCVIDDAQWLDRVSTEVLGFVARRLYADRVGMLFAVRAGGERTVVLDGLSELTVGALPEEAAGELLAASAGRPVDPRVGERIVAETEGNPLALVEFAGELTDEELSGALSLTRPLRFRGRLEELYLSRVRALPAEAQMLLLLAAADQLGEPGQIWKAAGQLVLDPEVAELPAVERLVSWTPTVQFRHPLMRSAAFTPPRPRPDDGLMRRWLMPATRSVTRTGGPGTWPMPRPARTSRSPPSWSARPTGPAAAAAGPAAPPSWSGRPSSPPAKGAGRSGCCRPPRPGWWPVRRPPHGCCWNERPRTWRIRGPGHRPDGWRALPCTRRANCPRRSRPCSTRPG